MDPKATLDRAEAALDDGDLDEAEAALGDYRTWRARGGFEPAGGDNRERALRARLRLAQRRQGE